MKQGKRKPRIGGPELTFCPVCREVLSDGRRYCSAECCDMRAIVPKIRRLCDDLATDDRDDDDLEEELA